MRPDTPAYLWDAARAARAIESFATARSHEEFGGGLLLLRQDMVQMCAADMYGVSQPAVSRIWRRILPLMDEALTPADAWSFITDWLDADQAWVPTPGGRHRDILGRLLIEGDLRGNLVTDAHLAALAIEHGTRICSFDSDFARFDGLGWINPDRR
ncbi:PIN domain-containing protein [Acidipropionibacterium virtanenii]|uniref:Ribonuclease VapC n=1 Tax=Acidipropionibacterium virtanenii TaxID=2057246 RepID=A0A344UT75_9ACTN|nr:PIN domain-containing protein [Acidipropionibacterium virtanenii]AXE38473.1 Ribonuclease VapC37 [Acidipropionibacterium virtanenii]